MRGFLASAVAHRYHVPIVKVFLSWSGERSKAVAEALKSWLPQVIQSLEPWISSEIDKGRKWSTELATELETVSVGIICLTRDNLSKPWILFEAGALSKNANTWTFLFDVTGANVEQPLAQFQHTENEKEDIRKLVHSIAGAARNAGEKVPEASVLNDIFETFWPKLEEKFKAVAPVKAGAVSSGAVRSDREILEEILEVVRRAQRSAGEPVAKISFAEDDLGSTFRGRDQSLEGPYRPLEPHLGGSYRGVEVEFKGADAAAVTRFCGLLSNQPSIRSVHHNENRTVVTVAFAYRLREFMIQPIIKEAASLAGLYVENLLFI